MHYVLYIFLGGNLNIYVATYHTLTLNEYSELLLYTVIDFFSIQKS